MSNFTPEQFDGTKINVEEPKAGSSGGNDFVTLNIKYGGGNFNYYNPSAVKLTKINENPKKKDGLSQGVVLETEALRKMSIEASRVILEGVVKHRNHPLMPGFCKNFDSVEKIMQAKAFGLKVKTLIHYPEIKGPDGKATGQPDPEALPLSYGKLIQSGPNHPKHPNTIFTKYWSAGILDAGNDAMIKAGKIKEDAFKFDARKIFASQSAMKGMPGVTVSDVYIAQGNLIIRVAISEVYITEWVTNESQTKKGLMEEIKKSGVKMDGPMSLPDVPPPDKQSDGPKTQGGYPAPVAPGGAKPTDPDVQNVGFDGDGSFSVTVKGQ
jgi:hypothetical protein